MNRKQAKIYTKLSREELASLKKGYGDCFELIRAFANGAIVELNLDDGRWVEVSDPTFHSADDYRLAKEQPAEQLDGKPLSGFEKNVIRALRSEKDSEK